MELSTNRKTLETLPDEVKLKCVKNLGGMDIIRLSMTNVSFRGLCEDELVWKAKCIDEFGFNWSSEGGRPWRAYLLKGI